MKTIQFAALVTALSMVCASPGWADSQAQTNEEAIYRKAHQLIDDNPWGGEALELAIGLTKSIFRNNPKSARARVLLGRLSYKYGYKQYDDFTPGSLPLAQKQFALARELEPTFYDAYFYGVYPFLFEKNFVKARELIQAAQKLEPGSLRNELLLAQLADDEERYPDAVRHANRVVASTREKKLLRDAYSALASAYQAQKQYDLAEKSYQNILALDPESPWANVNYASFLNRRKRYVDAIVYGEKALGLMEFGMGHEVLGRAYYQQGVRLYWEKQQYKESINYFAHAVQHRPTHANSHYGLGLAVLRTHASSGDIIELHRAEASLTTAVRLKPDHRDAKHMLVQVRAHLRSLGE